jgi:hypothetical protein
VTFNDGPAPGKQTQLQNLEFTNTNVIASSWMRDAPFRTLLLSTATCPLVEPGETSVPRRWLCKHVSTATESRDRWNRYTRDNRGTVGGGVLRCVRAEPICWERKPEGSTR